MVTAKTQYHLKKARQYVEEHLSVGDYYDEGQRVAGEWVGLGAESLGLSGKVRADDFLRLCDNRHPDTGETLTLRQNTTRAKGDQSAANRRIFYDFTFSPPKSVSLVADLGNDERILAAHAQVVQAALKDFEAFTATRVRLGRARHEVQKVVRPVVVLAPQRQQVVDMEKAGLPSPSTLTSFLVGRELVSGAVVVVDEAGQISGRQMLELLRLARQSKARVILSGDTRQHGAVEASDALFAIERHSGVKPVELHKIRRQDPSLGFDDSERTHIKRYREAVESAAAGKMGAIVACGLGDQTDKLAEEYLRLTEQNALAVVVSQTWAEVHRVNSRVRDALKSKGLLGASDSVVQALDRLDLTNAQKRDERFYPTNAVTRKRAAFALKSRQIIPCCCPTTNSPSPNSRATARSKP